MNNIVYPAKLDTLYRAIDYRQSQHDLPLIGISANFENGNSCIEHSYVISILQAGAIPVLLPVSGKNVLSGYRLQLPRGQE